MPYSFGINLCGAPQIDKSAFIGRKSEMASICERLVPKEGISTQRVLVLSGLGGMGKTQLSIEFAKRYQESFDTIYWMNAKSETAESELYRISGAGTTAWAGHRYWA